MTFGERLKKARLSLNLSQTDLAEKTGISERTIYSYEQTGKYPREGNRPKLAEALNVTIGYLMGDEEPPEKLDYSPFLSDVKGEFGSKGVREARDVIGRASALFAGGELDDESKDLFFQSLMEVYMDSKREAREKFTSKQRKSRKQHEG